MGLAIIGCLLLLLLGLISQRLAAAAGNYLASYGDADETVVLTDLLKMK